MGWRNLSIAGVDSADNLQVRDVIGNKSDAAVDAVGTTGSIMAYIKGLLSQQSGTAGIAAFPAAAAPGNGVSLAEVLRQVYDQTAVGSVFSITKTVTKNTLVAAGIDLTGVSTGSVELIGAYFQNDGTAVDSTGHGEVLELYTDNAKGSGSFWTAAHALMIANAVIGSAGATSWKGGVVLETGKKVKAKATTEDVTSAGTCNIVLVFRRLSAGATIAAAA